MQLKRASQSAFPEEDPEFQVAPMIDVLLVLMTFFMSITSTEVLKTKSTLTIDLPVATNSKLKDSAQSEIVINVAWDTGSKKGSIEFEEKVINQVEDIAPIIVRRKNNQPYFRAVIRAGENVPYSYVQQVMMACASANVGNISFSVLSQESKKAYKKEP